jgi:hypothetical protein
VVSHLNGVSSCRRHPDGLFCARSDNARHFTSGSSPSTVDDHIDELDPPELAPGVGSGRSCRVLVRTSFLGSALGALGGTTTPFITIATTGYDEHTITLWETDPRSVEPQLCAIAGDPIERAEWDRLAPDLQYRPPCR